MKYVKTMCLLVLFSTWGYSQTVNYKILKDEPEDVVNYWVNLELLQMDLSFKNMNGGSLGLGLNSVVNYKNKMGAEALFRRSYLVLGSKEVPRSQLELGAFYHLFSKRKSVKQKVVLDTKSYSSGGKTYTSTKSIKVPGTKLKSYGVRAGFAYNKEYLETTVEDHGFAGKYKYQTTGLYAGLLHTSQMVLKIDTDNFGRCGTGFVRRYFADLLFNPVRSIRDVTTDVKDQTNDVGMIGWRVGVEFLQPEPRKLHGNAMYTKVELGQRPMDGYYMMFSFGFSFKRKVAALSSFTPIREKE